MAMCAGTRQPGSGGYKGLSATLVIGVELAPERQRVGREARAPEVLGGLSPATPVRRSP